MIIGSILLLQLPGNTWMNEILANKNKNNVSKFYHNIN
jgi:hypothetical protein